MDGNVCLLSVLLSFFSFLFAVSKKHKPSSNTFFYGFVFTNPVELEVVQTMSSHESWVQEATGPLATLGRLAAAKVDIWGTEELPGSWT